MAFNGSGVFVRLYSWVAQRVAGFDIDSVKMDAEDNGFAAGLSQCITTNGQSTVTADIPWSNNKLIGLKDPTAPQDATTKAYVDTSVATVANATSSTIPLSGTDVTLTALQAASVLLILTGTLLTNVSVIYPAGMIGPRRIFNSCTGAFSVTIKNGAADGGLVVAQTLTTPVLFSGPHANLDAFTGLHPSTATLPATATTDLGAVPQGALSITGTTTITSFGSSAAIGETKILRFLGVLTLTHNAVSLILPGGANITTAPNDYALATQFIAGRWSVAYFSADGLPVISVGLVPTGAAIDFYANVPPTGYLETNGTLVSRTTFPNLWAFAQTSGAIVSDATWLGGGFDGCFSQGDGSTNFRLPDGRGYFKRNWDHGRGIDSGRNFGTSQLDAMQTHTHNVPLGASALTPVGANSTALSQPTIGPTTTDTGTGRSAGETRGRNIVLLCCIKT